MVIKNQAIDNHNNRLKKPVLWETPNFLKNWEEYFGTMSLNVYKKRDKQRNYSEKIFN